MKLEKIISIDRRYIFILIALAVMIPLLFPIGMNITPTDEVRAVYDYIEQIPPGSTILVALDYDPASLAELYPMTVAVLRHVFSRKVKVIGMTLWSTGATLGNMAMREAADGIARAGEDYAYLGFVTGATNVIMRMGEDISAVFPEDYGGTPMSELPVMEGIKNYKDISLMIDFAAGSSPVWWIVYAGTKYNQTIAVGCTAVSAVGYYPYLGSRQIIGLIGGMKGAAEYEKLITLLFSIESENQVDLDNESVSASLRQKFQNNGISLSQSATVSIENKGSNWLITDEDNDKSYLVMVSEEGLNVYAKTIGAATAGMDSQSIVHITIILLIILANVSYFIMRRRESSKEG